MGWARPDTTSWENRVAENTAEFDAGATSSSGPIVDSEILVAPFKGRMDLMVLYRWVGTLP